MGRVSPSHKPFGSTRERMGTCDPHKIRHSSLPQRVAPSGKKHKQARKNEPFCQLLRFGAMRCRIAKYP